MELLLVLRGRPGWVEAVGRLRALHADHGVAAAAEATTYADRYSDQRGAMVFDVVASRQRRYQSRVLPMVERFMGERAASDLRVLAQDGPGDAWGLRAGEPATMRDVANGLVRYCDEHGLGPEEGVRSWAASTAPVVGAHRLDPYVGGVRGIGPALFAYLRMRSGGDGIKPDLRVRRVLNHLGFDVPAGDGALLCLAAGAAQECGISLLELDQLLWSAA